MKANFLFMAAAVLAGISQAWGQVAHRPTLTRTAYWNTTTNAWGADSIRTRYGYDADGRETRAASKKYASVEDSSTLTLIAYDMAGHDTAGTTFTRINGNWAISDKATFRYDGAAHLLDQTYYFYGTGGAISSGTAFHSSYDAQGRVTEAIVQSLSAGAFSNIGRTVYHYPDPTGPAYDTLRQDTWNGPAGWVAQSRTVFKWFDFATNRDSSQLKQNYTNDRWVNAQLTRTRWLNATDTDITYYYATSGGRLYISSISGSRRMGLSNRAWALRFDTLTARLDSSSVGVQEMDAFGNVLFVTTFSFSQGIRTFQYGNRADFNYVGAGPDISRRISFTTSDGFIYTPYQRTDYEAYGPASLKPAPAGTLRAYPNPCQDRVTLTLPTALGADAVAEVYDRQGSLVRRARLHMGQASVDLRELPPGLYMARVSADGRIFTCRVVRQ